MKGINVRVSEYKDNACVIVLFEWLNIGTLITMNSHGYRVISSIALLKNIVQIQTNLSLLFVFIFLKRYFNLFTYVSLLLLLFPYRSPFHLHRFLSQQIKNDNLFFLYWEFNLKIIFHRRDFFKSIGFRKLDNPIVEIYKTL